jgi:hypothetical protein
MITVTAMAEREVLRVNPEAMHGVAQALSGAAKDFRPNAACSNTFTTCFWMVYINSDYLFRVEKSEAIVDGGKIPRSDY